MTVSMGRILSMPRGKRATLPHRGNVRVRGGSYQVRVYAGEDPVTGRDVYLTESTKDEKLVPEIQTRLVAQVDRQRSASTSATLGYLLDEWLQVHEIEHTTRENYVSYIERVIKPALGDVPVRKLKTQSLDRLYALLRRCRDRCDGKPFVEHRTEEPHECREVIHRRPPGRPTANWMSTHSCVERKCRAVECRSHECKPASASTVRLIHSIISGALDTAVRWDWIPSNVAAVAKRPKQRAPQPKPPTAQQAADIVTAAWEEDLDWGTLVWLVMMLGPRRGEIMALKISDVLFDEGVINLERSYVVRGGRKIHKDTKTHQARRPALDPYTLDVLRDHIGRITEKRRQLALPADSEAFLFSYQPDHGEPCNPDGVGHRYARMCKQIGIDSHMHALRHYSATELIRAGVDVRTVAGRLGHGGGGTTTLRVYAAWVAESDKRAAGLLADRLPRRPLSD